MEHTPGGVARMTLRVATWALVLALATACGPAQTVTSVGAASEGATSSAPAAPVPQTEEPTTPDDGGSEAGPPTVATSNGAAPVADLAAARLTAAVLPDPGANFRWARIRNGRRARPSARLFDPCEPTDYPTDSQRTDVRVRDLRVQEPGGAAPETATVRQNVARYTDAGAAADAADGFLRVARECAGGSGPEGTGSTTEVVVAADDRLLLQTTPQIGLTTTYTVVERRGDVVTLVSYSPGEVRDADDQARQIADAVTTKLDAAG